MATRSDQRLESGTPGFRRISGDFTCEVTLVPIPNTIVKLAGPMIVPTGAKVGYRRNLIHEPLELNASGAHFIDPPALVGRGVSRSTLRVVLAGRHLSADGNIAWRLPRHCHESKRVLIPSSSRSRLHWRSHGSFAGVVQW